MTIPPFAPGCFGSALTYDDTNSVCVACKFASACQPMHQEALVALRASFNITVKAKPTAPVTVDPARPAAPVLAVPKKVQELLDRLDRSELNVVANLQAGINPFEHSVLYLRIACHLLLRLQKPLTQPLLAAAFASKLNWAQGTADAHARMTIQALAHIGAIDNRDGLITIRKPA